jgi:hypothetical protein
MIAAAIPRTLSIRSTRPNLRYCYQFGAALHDESRWEKGPSDGDLSVN